MTSQGPRRFFARDANFAAQFAAFVAEPRGTTDSKATQIAAAIVGDVRERGFAAVAEYTLKFDHLDVTESSVKVSRQQMDRARDECPPDVTHALHRAADRVRAYHERQRPSDHEFEDEDGVALGWRWTPMDSVGLYVPGGRASYPSSVLMNAIPAKVAGVDRLTMVAPAPKGELSPAVLVAAQVAGADEVFTIGGAQAVAALAYGAGPIRPVDKIVGPGNAYVAAAKRLVFGDVGIDTIAGPSEILVIADKQNDPRWIAVDLLSQAEHDPSAQSILITDDEEFADAVGHQVNAVLSTLATSAVAGESWRAHGAVIVVEDIKTDAAALANHIAAEHVELAVDNPEAIASKIRHAGAIFLGRHTPEALGDYITGSNHVLPTTRAARFASGLSTLDFMKRISLQHVGEKGLQRIGPLAERLAEAEGLPAHALSISQRLSISES